MKKKVATHSRVSETEKVNERKGNLLCLRLNVKVKCETYWKSLVSKTSMCVPGVTESGMTE